MTSTIWDYKNWFSPYLFTYLLLFEFFLYLYTHLNSAIPSLQQVHQFLFTQKGVFTKESASEPWSTWQDTIPEESRIAEPFVFLLEYSSGSISTLPPKILSSIKKDDINQYLQSFVPSQHHTFWQDIISDTNSFILTEPAPRSFNPAAISKQVNLPHPKHPGQTTTPIPTLAISSDTQSVEPSDSTPSEPSTSTETTTSIISLSAPSNTITGIQDCKCKIEKGIL
jgi:hypothetical protein